MKNQPVNNKRGIALLITLFAMTLLIFIASEVSYDTNVEYLVASQQVGRIKAYYAAKSGVEISLLRILIYKKVMATFGKDLGEARSMLDPIWALPLSWPPMVPDDLNSVDKDQIDTAVKNSSLDAQYLTTISAEGGSLDINDLGSPIKALKESTRKQILKTFTSEVEHNEKFGKLYRNKNFEEIVNNLTDWVDEDKESLNGGDEKSSYSEIQNDFIPPNQPFKTIEELHMVKGITEDIYAVLAKSVTVFGTKGINVNYSSKDMLKTLDVSMTDEIVDAVIERRTDPKKGGPFKSADDFMGFISSHGANIKAIEESKIPLLTEPEYNFRIRSTGQYSNTSREITVVTYDFENLKEKFIEMLDKQDKESKPAEEEKPAGEKPPPNPDAEKATTEKKEQVKVPKGRPTIVFWEET